MAGFGFAIFLGAFLLFQVQPLLGKYILPWFGGGPGVWTTCMLFFQVLLLGGYAYAHLSARCLRPRAQALLHVALLLIALALLPITPAEHWKPSGDEDPTLRILALLGATIGLPYFVLSSTGPLMQQWFRRVRPAASPYRLFALSNAASLLALVSFPFFFETHFSRQTQAQFWSWALVGFAITCIYCALKVWREFRASSDAVSSAATGAHPLPAEITRPRAIQVALWVLLPACASVLLLATTNKLCQDVAVIPFLWVLPLALYLLSFIICFDNPRWYLRPIFSVALVAALTATCWILFEGTDALLFAQIITFGATLFVCCMVCHGELYRIKPDAAYLTAFYLAIAAGGAAGAICVAVLAPLLFSDYYELHWGLLSCALLLFVVWVQERPAPGYSPTGELPCSPLIPDSTANAAAAGEPKSFSGWLTALQNWPATSRRSRMMACSFLLIGTALLGAALWQETRSEKKESIFRSRNFYGVLTVYEYQKDLPQGRYHLLQHGGITHGLQFTDPDQAKWRTTYYGPGSGIDHATRLLPKASRRLGVVGLGTGTMAAFGRAGDSIRIYEINPAVIRLANSYFTYLSNTSAQVEIVLGDARLSMERESPQQFDLLALDAFSSDAIPVHLLTKEAFQLYQRHVKTNGIIAIHTSNHYLDLEPVVVNLANYFNYKVVIIDYEEEEHGADWWFYSSTWILLSQDKSLFDHPAIRNVSKPLKTNQITMWTDDFASLFQVWHN